MVVMLDCTLSILEKVRKLSLAKLRFVLNFLRRSRVLVKLKFVKTGNWRKLWKWKANKSFWITKPLFCVIRYNGSNTWRWWISNQRVDMRNSSSERYWRNPSRLIRNEKGDGIDTSGLYKGQHDVQKQRIVRKLEDSKKSLLGKSEMSFVILLEERRKEVQTHTCHSKFWLFVFFNSTYF